MGQEQNEIALSSHIRTDEELEEAVLQHVRNISGYRVPLLVNQVTFDRAVTVIAISSRRQYKNLVVREQATLVYLKID